MDKKRQLNKQTNGQKRQLNKQTNGNIKFKPDTRFRAYKFPEDFKDKAKSIDIDDNP